LDVEESYPVPQEQWDVFVSNFRALDDEKRGLFRKWFASQELGEKPQRGMEAEGFEKAQVEVIRLSFGAEEVPPEEIPEETY